MSLVKNISIPSNIKLSKNDDVNEFMNSFIYHNENFFMTCISSGIKKIKDNNRFLLKSQNVGIHYETCRYKWGSVGLMNQMIKRGHVTIAKDHMNDCYCLDATAKLVNRILSNIYRAIENIKCVKEGRYDDRNFSICK